VENALEKRKVFSFGEGILGPRWTLSSPSMQARGVK
jgi:hypothetical protein